VTTLKNKSGSINEILLDLQNTSQVKVFSIDCFDTLLWRRLDSPKDLLRANAENFPSADRILCESTARGKKEILTGNSEPTIVEIAKEYLLDGAPSDWKSLAQSEVDAEIRHGYVFKPALNALRVAKSLGLRTIVVSDTYYTEPQLRQILGSVNAEVLGLIDRIYCSCEYGRAKATGLWPIVFNRERLRPKEIYHVGDNRVADLEVPARLGVVARHFEKHQAAVWEVLKARANPAKVFLNRTNAGNAIPSPFHGWLAEHARGDLTRDQIIAYTWLGPIMYAFAAFMKQEAEILSKQYGASRIKFAFLYRDGYILERASKALDPDINAYGVRISRFSSHAASLCDEETIFDATRYLVRSFHFNKILDQLLVGEKLQKRILASVNTVGDDPAARRHKFYTEIKRPEVQRHILQNAKAYRARLIKHIERTTKIEEGDTLVLVDVGYDGTTQKVLTKALEQDMGINVIARYLLALPAHGWEHRRKALISPKKVDDQALKAMTRHIAGFEVFCSSHDASVKDYDEQGNPLFTSVVEMSSAAINEIQQIQNHSIEFIESCQAYFSATGFPEEDELWKSAAIDLMRFNYTPSRAEVDLMQDLTFEANLGLDASLSLVDLEQGQARMRTRGISMLTHEITLDMRTNSPAELRHVHMDLALALMTSHRYDLSYAFSESTYRQDSVEILFASANQSHTIASKATSTFDGYFNILIPQMDYDTVVLLGKNYRMLQLECITLIDKEHFYSASEALYTTTFTLGVDCFIDGAKELSKNIFLFKSQGFLYIPAQGEKDRDFVFNIVFRPLEKRVLEQVDVIDKVTYAAEIAQ